MKKAVIFDLDGTILDTIADLHDAACFALNKLGCMIPNLNDTKNAIGDGLYNLLDRLSGHLLTPDMLAKGCSYFVEYYKVHLFDKTKPYDGIVSLMQDLKASNIKIFVLSNKDDFGVQALIKHFFNGLVDKSLGHKKDLLVLKPSPILFDYLLKDEFDLNKDDLIFIGDSKTDILSANNYGIDCLITSWGYGKDLDKYHDFKLISSIEEIKDAIL